MQLLPIFRSWIIIWGNFLHLSRQVFPLRGRPFFVYFIAHFLVLPYCVFVDAAAYAISCFDVFSQLLQFSFESTSVLRVSKASKACDNIKSTLDLQITVNMWHFCVVPIQKVSAHIDVLSR